MSGSLKHPRKNKPTFQRYWSEDHLLRNKVARIRKNSGLKAEQLVAEFERRYPALKKARS